jgi:hypothetical protein
MCDSQKTKKYTTRPSPAFPANECCGEVKVGNDGRMYISVANKNGVCSWKLHKAGSPKKEVSKKSPAKKRANKSPTKKSPAKKTAKKEKRDREYDEEMFAANPFNPERKKSPKKGSVKKAWMFSVVLAFTPDSGTDGQPNFKSSAFKTWFNKYWKTGDTLGLEDILPGDLDGAEGFDFSPVASDGRMEGDMIVKNYESFGKNNESMEFGDEVALAIRRHITHGAADGYAEGPGGYYSPPNDEGKVWFVDAKKVVPGGY